MSDLLLFNKKLRKSVECEDHVAKMRNNRVNFSAQYIRVNKNEINYSALSNYLKYIFVVSLKQCYDSRVMKKVFHKWHEDEETSQPRKIILTNQEAIQLIRRMQKIMLNHQMLDSSVSLREEVQKLQKQLHSYQNSYKDMQDKQTQLTTFQLDKQGKQRSQALVQKIIKYKGCLFQKLSTIKEQIINKKEQLKHVEKELQFANQYTTRLSKHLTKIILKEVRNLLKQTIIGILQISNKIIKQGEVDNQQVYVIFEQTYRTIKMKKTTVVKYFGSDFYLEKVNYFAAIMASRIQKDQKQLQNSNIVCCHLCMKICKLQKMKFCQIPTGQTQIKPYPSTDFLNYRKNYLEGDFFYQSTGDHIIPFYLYNKNGKDKLTCNRAFCQDCVQHCVDKPFSCPYCLGFCVCRRCEKAVAIVRLMAIDFQNDPEGVKPYHELLKLFGGKQHKDISQYLKLRQPNQLAEFYLAKKIFVSFNDKYSTSTPKIKLSNPKKPVNFQIFNISKVQPKILNLSTDSKCFQSSKKQQKVESNIQNSVLQNYDEYLNQLLEPIFDKNAKYPSQNDKEAICYQYKK